MSKRWYAFTGTDSDAYTLNKYRFATQAPSGCNTGYHICAIYAAYGGINPSVLSSRVQNYIADALANGVNQPTLGSKYYVYSKQTD